jgi:hypothetical protein
LWPFVPGGRVFSSSSPTVTRKLSGVFVRFSCAARNNLVWVKVGEPNNRKAKQHSYHVEELLVKQRQHVHGGEY